MTTPSPATFHGRAIHPRLVWIPVTLVFVAVGLFALFAMTGSSVWLQSGLAVDLAAVLTALSVAVPGMLDWIAIPGAHAAKRAGAAHIALNLGFIGLLTVNLVVHREVLLELLAGHSTRFAWQDPAIALGLSGAALGVMLLSGAAGWTVSQRLAADPPPRQRRTDEHTPRPLVGGRA